jgi:hypothetical protein
MRRSVALDLSHVLRYVADAYNLTQKEILGRGRTQLVAEARAVAYYLARREGHSLPRLGGAFGRDHTTILSGLRRAALVMRREPAVANMVAAFDLHMEQERGKPCGDTLALQCNSEGNPRETLCADSAHTLYVTPVDCVGNSGVESNSPREAAE